MQCGTLQSSNFWNSCGVLRLCVSPAPISRFARLTVFDAEFMFPVFDAGYRFFRAWHRLCVFLHLARVPCFPRLATAAFNWCSRCWRPSWLALGIVENCCKWFENLLCQSSPVERRVVPELREKNWRFKMSRFFDLAELSGPLITGGPCLAFLYGLFCLKDNFQKRC